MIPKEFLFGGGGDPDDPCARLYFDRMRVIQRRAAKRVRRACAQIRRMIERAVREERGIS